MCSEPATRAPRSGCCGANSSRIAMRPGISVSAIAISLRPQAASCRSATLKSVKFLVSVTSFIASLLVSRVRCAAMREISLADALRIRGQRAPLQVETPSLAGRGSIPPKRPVATLLGDDADYSARRKDAGKLPGLPTGAGGGALRQQSCDEARLALVETLGVESLLEREELVIQMVTELVDQRPQKGLECNDLSPLRRT